VSVIIGFLIRKHRLLIFYLILSILAIHRAILRERIGMLVWFVMMRILRGEYARCMIFIVDRSVMISSPGLGWSGVEGVL
jgi:hypothetical protein